MELPSLPELSVITKVVKEKNYTPCSKASTQ